MHKLTITIPEQLAQRVRSEAEGLSVSPEKRVLEILEGAVAPAENFAEGRAAGGLAKLTALLQRIPAIGYIAASPAKEPYWWVKLQINLNSLIAWEVIQYLGFVLNYISLEERLPTVFKPVSPPPYMNGGPDQFLSWVIEAELPFLDAGSIADTLQDRLPDPLEDPARWLEQEEDEEEDDEE